MYIRAVQGIYVDINLGLAQLSCQSFHEPRGGTESKGGKKLTSKSYRLSFFCVGVVFQVFMLRQQF